MWENVYEGFAPSQEIYTRTQIVVNGDIYDARKVVWIVSH